jgi:hypothetical protein
MTGIDQSIWSMYLYICYDMVRGSACKIKIHSSPRQKRRLFQYAYVSV